MRFLYFGHSRLSYDTDQEKKAIEKIRKRFPNHRIVNPNLDKHQINCGDFYTGVPGTEMEYFLNLTKMCEIGVFMVYDESKWSPGSYTEATRMMEDGKKVYIFSPNNWRLRRLKKIDDHYTFAEESEKLKDKGLTVLAGENG